jgi:hypothetical protein
MRYKVINLDLIIKVQTEKTPLVADFMGRKYELGPGEHSFVFPLSKIDQIFEINFSGFTPQEKSQKIELELFYNKKKLDTKKISSFLMKNNLYVENKLIDVYDKVYFNGTLFIKFINSWFEIEIISGFTISKDKKDFISISEGDHQQAEHFYKRLLENKNKTHFIALVGTCHQIDTKKKYTPSLFTKLQKEYPNESLLNYSSAGLNDWCILHNSLWVLDHLKVKNLLFTLNVGTYMPYKIRIFDHISYWPFLNAPSPSNFKYQQQLKLYRFNRNKISMWENILNKKLQFLLQRCKDEKVNPIILNYGSGKIWHNKDHINWYSEYKNNHYVHLDKRTQVTNNKVFDKIQSIIV